MGLHFFENSCSDSRKLRKSYAYHCNLSFTSTYGVYLIKHWPYMFQMREQIFDFHEEPFSYLMKGYIRAQYLWND